MDWTEKYFDELYMKFILEQQKDEITEMQVDLIAKFLKSNAYILDAGCGIGRHSFSLSKRGFKVLGIDSSDLYIKRAKEILVSSQLTDIKFEVKDMREDLGFELFDAIINIWSSFGYFEDNVNNKIMENFYRALKKGGILFIDIENRDYILKHFISETFKEKEGIFILERRNFNPIKSVITTHRYFIVGSERKEYVRHLRMYTVTEMINITKENNFAIQKVMGNYDGSKFHSESPRIILVCRK